MLPSQTAAHRTGIPIAALDCNKLRTHAILAGQEILKTVHITDSRVTEEVNLRAAVTAYNSTHNSGKVQSLPATDVKWSQGAYGHLIATAALNGPVVVYDINKTAEVQCLQEHRSQVHRLAFDPHIGRYLLSGGSDGTIKFWDLRSFSHGKATMLIRSSKTYSGRSNAIRDVRWSPTQAPSDTVEFASASDSGVIQKWDLRNSEFPLLRLNAHEKPCMSIDWHPDGRHLLSAGLDRYIRIWDFENPNRRQKASFQLRTPHAVMNARWRPACWSSEADESGTWQSTQIVTSYTKDDPRLHVWDLRRPHLPFRELDRYNSPATDLLWASKDLLWTVGNEGMFTQTDINFSTQVHEHIPPCAMGWSHSDNYVAFFEDRRENRDTGLENPAAAFLSIPKAKLSSGDEVAISRSLTDDEAPFEALDSTSFSRRSSKTTAAQSARSLKSQASTPPGPDDQPHVLSLDKAVFDRADLFQNIQFGFSSTANGAVASSDLARYLAHHYAPPMRINQDMEPVRILSRLREAFASNAEVCDDVAMHRMAQSWRILAAVIVPELESWAEKNREQRLNKHKQAELKKSTTHTLRAPDASEVDAESLLDLSSDQPRSERPIQLVKGRKAQLLDQESTSSISTPLARPLPDSPHFKRTSGRTGYVALDDGIGGMPPLPPSVAASHSAAAVASRALHDDSDILGITPPLSPEKVRGSPDDQEGSADPNGSPTSLSPSPAQKYDKASRDPRVQLKLQEERRAALRDYKAPARPLLNFDHNLQQEVDPVNRDRISDASFSMFSAASQSFSKQMLNNGASFNSQDSRVRNSVESDEEFVVGRSDSFDISWPKQSSRLEQPLQVESIDMPDSEENATKFIQASGGEDLDRQNSIRVDTYSVLKSSDKVNADAKEPSPDSTPHVHRASAVVVEGTRPPNLASEEFIIEDFRQVEKSDYVSKIPRAWSSPYLIAHTIAFDLSLGFAHGQFSAHLLVLVYQFVFLSTTKSLQTDQGLGTGEAVQRFLDQGTNRKIFEGVFQVYAQYLRDLKCSVPLADLQAWCYEMKFPSFQKLSTDSRDSSVAEASGNPNLLAVACRSCHELQSNPSRTCNKCLKAPAVCPICLSVYDEPEKKYRSGRPEQSSAIENSILQLWSICPSCGHGSHFQCMQDWLAQDDAGGMCPVQACGCDCGPGPARTQRIQAQQAHEDELRLIRGSSGSVATSSRDGRRVTASAAVQKARTVLREGERATQSGDERGPFVSRTRSSRSGLGGHLNTAAIQGQTSHRKSVRLVTPSEN